MFYHIRYQTGELDDVVRDMHEGKIPAMDVMDLQELEEVLVRLENHKVYRIKDCPYDTNARNVLKEPDFEFRIAFYEKPVSYTEADDNKIMYIDFFFEPYIDKTYDPVGEM